MFKRLMKLMALGLVLGFSSPVFAAPKQIIKFYTPTQGSQPMGDNISMVTMANNPLPAMANGVYAGVSPEAWTGMGNVPDLHFGSSGWIKIDHVRIQIGATDNSGKLVFYQPHLAWAVMKGGNFVESFEMPVAVEGLPEPFTLPPNGMVVSASYDPQFGLFMSNKDFGGGDCVRAYINIQANNPDTKPHGVWLYVEIVYEQL